MTQYCEEVRSAQFPGAEHTYKIDEAEVAKFRELVRKK
jgi:hypothetical protein